VLQEALFGEPLDHPGDGSRREVEEMRDLGGARRGAAKREMVDRLEIVLDGPG
jgi:hypothetical protein